MDWLNEPPSWNAQGDALLVTAGPKTDFWRTTHYGFILAASTPNGANSQWADDSVHRA